MSRRAGFPQVFMSRPIPFPLKPKGKFLALTANKCWLAQTISILRQATCIASTNRSVTTTTTFRLRFSTTVQVDTLTNRRWLECQVTPSCQHSRPCFCTLVHRPASPIHRRAKYLNQCVCNGQDAYRALVGKTFLAV